jgi:hypothetical protein
MDPAIAKLVITGLVGIGGWYAFTPPSYTSTGDKLHVDGMFGYVAYKLAILTKVLFAYCFLRMVHLPLVHV